MDVTPEAPPHDACLLQSSQTVIPDDIAAVGVVTPAKGQELPLYWELLSELDRATYTRIRVAFASPVCKHRRNSSTKINGEILNSVKSFVIRSDEDDWKRALVCGICWMPDMIAINTRQLRLLLSKCKSSINALFLNLGYTTIPTNNDFATSLVRVFPNLKDNFAELRKWTPRIPAINAQAVGVPVPLPVPLPEEMDLTHDAQQLQIVAEEPLPQISDMKKPGSQ